MGKPGVAITVINTVGCGIDTTSGGNVEHPVKVVSCYDGPSEETTTEVIGPVEIIDFETPVVRNKHIEHHNKPKVETVFEVEVA